MSRLPDEFTDRTKHMGAIQLQNHKSEHRGQTKSVPSRKEDVFYVRV